MKKYYLLLFAFFISTSVYALDTNYISIRKYSGMICSGDEAYNTYDILYHGQTLLFISPSTNYNLNFADYYEVPYENLNLPKDIQNFIGNHINLIFNYDQNDIAKHLSRIIYEYLYPERDFIYCYSSKYTQERYDETKQMVHSVAFGTPFNEKIVFKENEAYTFANEYLKYFILVDNAGLDITQENNTLLISGKAGEYEIRFKRKASGLSASKAYTDGTHYLISTGEFTEDEFVLNVTIEKLNLQLNVLADDQSVADLCFDVYQDGSLHANLCSDKDGVIKGTFSEGIYEFKQSSLLDYYTKDNFIIDLTSDMNQKIVIEKIIVEDTENDKVEYEEPMPDQDDAPLDEEETEAEEEPVYVTDKDESFTQEDNQIDASKKDPLEDEPSNDVNDDPLPSVKEEPVFEDDVILPPHTSVGGNYRCLALDGLILGSFIIKILKNEQKCKKM